MYLLVVGGGGYLGREIVNQAIRLRWKVVSLSLNKKKMNWEIRNADEGARIKAIVLMALKHLENGADISLIKAILIQARDEE